MRAAAFLSGVGRFAWGAAGAASLAMALAGCSSGTSRFDSFSLAQNPGGGSYDTANLADPSSTASLAPALPQESVYNGPSAAPQQYGR